MSRQAVAVRSLPDMPREPADTIQVSVRIEKAWVNELDALATAMSRPGIELARADVLRAAIARGIEELKAEVIPTDRKSEPKQKGRR
jgi:hypothetical protein